MAEFEADRAWAIIRAVCRCPPGADDLPAGPIRIAPGGLWSAGCAVSAEAALLFDTLLPIACSRPDYVIAQIGQSLDGRIATASGCSHYVTGAASRTHLHRLRALADAVVVGAGTVAADNPQLTVRHVAGDSPVRVVLDPKGRVPHASRVFTDSGPPTWHVVRRLETAAPGAIPLSMPDVDAHDIPRRLLDVLAGQDLRRILVEGGGITISRFIEAGCVDRLHAVVAPFLIGSGRPALTLAEIDTLAQAIRPSCRTCALGADQLYDLDLRKLEAI
jgi:riboflavin-specific deaminase-like protein